MAYPVRLSYGCVYNFSKTYYIFIKHLANITQLHDFYINPTSDKYFIIASNIMEIHISVSMKRHKDWRIF